MSGLSDVPKDDLRRGAARSDGRLVVSYPKSGRTWLRFALMEGGIDATFTHAGGSNNRREVGRPYRAIPEKLRDVPVVFLHRNPADTAVSLYWQVTRRIMPRWSRRWLGLWLPLTLRGAMPPEDIDAFVRSPLYGIEKVCIYNRLWLDHVAGRSDCLVLSYEDMRADPAAGFQRLLDHWGETGTTGAALAEASRFERMRAVEAAGASRLPHLAPKAGGTEAAKVRKGKVGGYVEELRPETVDFCRATAARYGFAV